MALAIPIHRVNGNALVERSHVPPTGRTPVPFNGASPPARQQGARSAFLYPERAHPHAVRRRTRTGRSVPANGKQERVKDQTIGLASGRTVGFTDYGVPDATAVLWCHGGPGSRLEPAYLRRQASEAGLRIIGIGRPGYGLSTPQPGRTIAGWVPEALAVADHLGIGQFQAVREPGVKWTIAASGRREPAATPATGRGRSAASAQRRRRRRR